MTRKDYCQHSRSQWTESGTRSVSLVDWSIEHSKTTYQPRRRVAKKNKPKPCRKPKATVSQGDAKRAKVNVKIRDDMVQALNTIIRIVNTLSESNMREVIDVTEEDD